MTERQLYRLVLLLATLAPSATVRAQQPVAIVRVAAISDTAVDSSVAREVDIARMRGIPIQPLLAKAREGRLKRAPVPRIRAAIIALAARLDSARAALGAAATVDELTAGAEALAAGADATAVRAVRMASVGEPVSAPLGALAQLVASGVPPARAVTMIVDLLRRRATPSQVIAFGNSVEADAAGGLPGEEAAQFRWREFETSGAIGTNANALNASDAPPPPGALNATSRPSSPPTKPPRRRP
jgi:hypothetical protein